MCVFGQLTYMGRPEQEPPPPPTLKHTDTHGVNGPSSGVPVAEWLNFHLAPARLQGTHLTVRVAWPRPLTYGNLTLPTKRVVGGGFS